ncbi:cytochrome c oxidase subunit [Lynx pardinus]|uniref:Cytochrome c oxidase subunit 7A2, mitochondrial n=1 Tax=Lynx pardinus TaxID=191816 RepID=A0A485NB83_LYNPA|nr:cytochrome c oxidase subunit [Lynx pardinus]
MVRGSSPSSARSIKFPDACARPEGSSGSGVAVLVSGVRLLRLVGSNRAKMLRNLLALRQIAQRTISTASRRQIENKVPEKQKLFQEDNGIPVHLKGGIADALLYRATMMLTVGGTAYAIYQLAMASFPKKQD